MTERLHFPFSLSRIREGNGNPLQCSCLENPRDRGVCWAAVYGVAQSQTQLKRLSSSSFPGEPNGKEPACGRDVGSSWLCLLVYIFYFLTTLPVGSYFPNQELNPHCLKWKCRVLTAGPPGKSLNVSL